MLGCIYLSTVCHEEKCGVLLGQTNKSIKRCCPPCWQVDCVEAVLELRGFVEALLQGLVPDSEKRWRTERAGLLLQLLCASQRCLSLNGDCRPLLNLIQQLLPTCQQVTQQLFFDSITFELVMVWNMVFSKLDKLRLCQYFKHTLCINCSCAVSNSIVICRSCHWTSCWWAWPCSCSRPLQHSRATCSVWVNTHLNKCILSFIKYSIIHQRCLLHYSMTNSQGYRVRNES